MIMILPTGLLAHFGSDFALRYSRIFAEKNELAAVLQTFKASRDQGEILDLEILLSDIVGVFSIKTNEDFRVPEGHLDQRSLTRADLTMTSPRRHKTTASSTRS